MTPPGSFLGSRTESGSGLVLAMETAGKEGSVALAEWVEEGGTWRESGGELRCLRVLCQGTLTEEREHAARLVPAVQGVMEDAGAGPMDLGGVVVGAGPGSFTGVRVAASTAKGLAWSLDVPLWPFSSLAGAAVGAREETTRARVVLFDARGDRVYAAAYRLVRGSLETLMSPRATTVGRILEGQIPAGAALMGDGARRHKDLLEPAGWEVLPGPAGRPSATGLLRLLDLDPGAPPVRDLPSWEPDYLRGSGAERGRRVRSARGNS